MDLVSAHLALWLGACVVAFACYYARPSCRCNPHMSGQLRCLSGVLLCGQPLVGALMCGMSGAMLLAVGARPLGWAPLAVLLCLHAGFVFMVHFDVEAWPVVHFASLLVIVASGLALVALLPVPQVASGLFYAASALFVGVILLNCAVVRWAPPGLTVQALVEIVWAASMVACLGCFVWA